MEKHNYKREIEKYGAGAFVPKGNSMWPIIKNKSCTVIIEKKKERLKLYDVGMYYREDGSFILHRVIKVLEKGYLFQGDSQLFDEEVDEERVFAVLTGYYKGQTYHSVEEEKYKNKIVNWYKKKNKKPLSLKIHNFKNRVIAKIKRILKKEIQ